MRTLNQSNPKKAAEEAKETALDLNQTLNLNIKMLEEIKVKFNGSSKKIMFKKKRKRNED